MRIHLRSVIILIRSRDSWKQSANKMQGKYFFTTLVLMITLSERMASCHILTSTNSEVSLPTCMKMLTYAVMDVLCPRYGAGAYGDYSSEEVNMPPIPREMVMSKWEQRENLVKKCCTKPCTSAELMAIC